MTDSELNPSMRIIGSFRNGTVKDYSLQVREEDELGIWYRTIGRTKRAWRLKRWLKKYKNIKVI